MESFSAASHHDILVLLVQITILLFTARALGEIAQRLGQPSVVGEIMAGIILGPSLLSSLFPVLGEWIVPQTAVQGYLLEIISLLGAMFLLLITGLETDLTLIKRHARTAVGVSFGGIVVTFCTGFLLGQYLPDFLLADPTQRLVFSLFVATAMSISAIPVIAKVLMDLNLMRRDIGQTIIAAGMSDDTIGWMLLSVVAGLASGEAVSAGSLLQTVGSVAAFMVLSFTIGRWIVKKSLDYVQDNVISRDKLLTLVMVFTFAWGALTQAFNLEAVLGAFVMGILFGQMPRLPETVHHKLESMALGIFSPIFFAVAGLKVNIQNLFDPQLILITLLVIAVATGGKVVGTYLGARVIGRRDHWTSLSFGAGLNARGAMEIIIATIGLNLGILSQDMFSIIVIMAMTTSLMAPPALRWVLKRVKPEEQELKRLRQEEMAVGSLIANIHRVLLPMRQRPGGGAVQTIEAQLLRKLGQNLNLSVTLLTIAAKGQRAGGQTYLNELSPLFDEHELVKKVLEGDHAAEFILDEAHKDYDLMVLGASEENRGTDVLFTPLVDYLVRLAPCPTMIVQGRRVQSDWAPRRILIPTNGSQAAQQAADLGFALATNGEEVIILHVVVEGKSNYSPDASGEMLERQLAIGWHMVDELRQRAEAREVKADTEVRVGLDPETMIMAVAREKGADLIILGTDVRPGTDRLFLGPGVDRILKGSPCPVVVLNH
ncbi:MAG: universal stress protein [Chloroflexi bacterium]|nr:sodium:proton antiporter [Chloroflexota bacterium]NOG37294.1 universal stress protein [Chloroflexota bacterium]GIK57015.1 MAG: Na+/H+ antiporter [Chloroflexota bacterium]